MALRHTVALNVATRVPVAVEVEEAVTIADTYAMPVASPVALTEATPDISHALARTTLSNLTTYTRNRSGGPPVGAEAAAVAIPDRSITHTVTSSDTLAGICLRYNVNSAVLKRYNSFFRDNVQSCRTLIIPCLSVPFHNTTPVPGFAATQVVQARWKNQDEWLPAQIVQRNTDGTYRLLYEGRYTLDQVPPSNIRATSVRADDEDIKRAFVVGQTMADIERAFSLGQISGASATSNDDTSVDADIESSFSLGQVAYAYTEGQALSRRKSVADIKPDADTQSAFSLGQRLASLERAFSLGQTSGASAVSDGDTSVDADTQSAFLLGQTSGALTDIERAFSLGQTSGASAMSDGDTSVDPDIERAFSLGQTA